ncbi:MAG TPA: alpha/beta hydrolase [Variovorax sp.]|nr:alpha/beta hydrolase [Variovorax sp.]
MRRATAACGLVVILGWMSVATAQTAWPAYMATLQPGPSESDVAAVLPADVKVLPPDAALAPAKARWSGIWNGWSCFARQCDIHIAVEQVSEARATLAYVGANALQGQITDRAEASFVGDELHAQLRTGNKLVLRLRDSADMEMSLWNPEGKLLSAGVLTQKPLRYERRVSRIPTPWVEDGKAQTLELVSYLPPGGGKGPLPTLIFNHGSTGDGDKPEWFKHTATAPELAQYFVDRGWQVLMPQRRGRGKSDGLYDEGFERDRSRYACKAELSLPGVERAVADLDVVMAYVKTLPSVDSRHMMIGGISRGGVLSVVYAGTRPDTFEGVVNFVGGWVGGRCEDAERVNPVLFRRGAAFKGPQIWLYGDKDPFYSLSHSRKNFDAFVAAGGKGRFLTYPPPPGQIGHFISQSPALWSADMDSYLQEVDRR